MFPNEHSKRREREMAGYDEYARRVREAVKNFREGVCPGSK